MKYIITYLLILLFPYFKRGFEELILTITKILILPIKVWQNLRKSKNRSGVNSKN